MAGVLQLRERDWANVITAHEGDPLAYTWRLSHLTLGEHVLQPPNKGKKVCKIPDLPCVTLSCLGSGAAVWTEADAHATQSDGQQNTGIRVLCSITSIQWWASLRRGPSYGVVDQQSSFDRCGPYPAGCTSRARCPGECCGGEQLRQLWAGGHRCRPRGPL